MLWVKDVQATVDYYVNTLGFVAGKYESSIGWGIRSGPIFTGPVPIWTIWRRTMSGG